MTDWNPFAIAQQQLDEALKHLDLDEATHELIRRPMPEHQVARPAKMNDCTTRIFKA